MRRRTPPQKRISESLKRFNVAAWGRQSGKTTFGLDKMTYKPLQGRPFGIYWYILQTNTAAEVAFERFWEMHFKSRLLLKKPNESQKFAQLINGATIFFKSGEVFENLRAETLDGCIIDEMRQQRRELWSMIIRPMLSRRKGWCDFYSTPNGFDHFYDLFEYAKLHPDEWGSFHSPSTEAWWWTQAEIESARASMSEAEFAQEISAEFRDLTAGKAYLSFGQWNISAQNPFAEPGERLSPYLPIVVGLDFNVSPMCWAIGQHRNGTYHWFDEIAIRNTNTQACVPLLIDKIKSHAPGVILIGDATGNSRNTKATESDYAIICNALREAGIKWKNQTPKSNPPVKDRVNLVNSKLRNAKGEVNMTINPIGCPTLKRDFDRVLWKEGSSNAMLDQSGSNSDLTHMSDGVGYVVSVLSPISISGSVGGLKVILR